MECRTRINNRLPTLHICTGCGVGVISDTKISLDINEHPKVSVTNKYGNDDQLARCYICKDTRSYDELAIAECKDTRSIKA